MRHARERDSYNGDDDCEEKLWRNKCAQQKKKKNDGLCVFGRIKINRVQFIPAWPIQMHSIQRENWVHAKRQTSDNVASASVIGAGTHSARNEERKNRPFDDSIADLISIESGRRTCARAIFKLTLAMCLFNKIANAIRRMRFRYFAMQKRPKKKKATEKLRTARKTTNRRRRRRSNERLRN